MTKSICDIDKVKSKEITIREYKESDGEQAIMLVIESFYSKFTHLKQMSKTVLYKLLLDLKLDQDLLLSENYVAELNGTIVGIIGLRRKNYQRVKKFKIIKLVNIYGIINVSLVLLSLNLMSSQKIKNNEVYIEHVAVSHHLQGRGIGSSLIKYCINQYGSDEVVKEVTLNVAANNIGAVKLYQKLGFKQQTKINSILTSVFLGEKTWLYMKKRT